jgi:hypothetical protein
MDWITILVLLAIVGVVGWYLGKSLFGAKKAMSAAVVLVVIAGGVLWYQGELPDISADTTTTTTATAASFDIDLVSNNTDGATTQDNTSAADNDLSFTTPFEYSTTTTPTSILNCTNNGTFVDPTYIFDVTPSAPAGATADDLVTITYEMVDPGDAITVSGTDYAVISDHDDGGINAFWTITDKSDLSSVKDHDMVSGQVSMLYTEAYRLNLTLVLHDDGLARLTDYDTVTIYAKVCGKTFPIILQLVEE